jgi:MFS family permease
VVFAPLVEFLKADFTGATNATIGFAVTLAWVGSALPRLPTGYLLTRVPRHYVVGATGLILAGASLFIAAATSVEGVMVGAFLVGLASGSYFIAANPLVSELFPDRVGQAIGIHGMASQVGAVAASPLVLGAVALGGWRITFQIMAVVALAATAAFVLLARRTDLPTAGTDDRDLLAAVASQWRIVLAGVVIIGLCGFVWQGLFNFFVTYVDGRGFTRQGANLLLTGVFAAGIPAFVVTGWLSDRLPMVPLLITVVAAYAVCLLALTLPLGVAGVVAVSLALGYVIHSLFPAMDTYLLASLPDRHRASAYAAYSATMMLVQAGASGAVGYATDAGVTFDTIYRTGGTAVLVLAVALAGAHLLGWVPTGASHDRGDGLDANGERAVE